MKHRITVGIIFPLGCLSVFIVKSTSSVHYYFVGRVFESRFHYITLAGLELII